LIHLILANGGLLTGITLTVHKSLLFWCQAVMSLHFTDVRSLCLQRHVAATCERFVLLLGFIA